MEASGGARNSAPGTLTQLFFDAVEKYNLPNALQLKVDGTYRPISHQQLAERVRHAALGLQELGLRPGDRVAILSENRPEWAIADYACLASGLTDVPLYPNLPPEQLPYLLNDSGAVAIFCSTAAQSAKVVEVRSKIPKLKYIIGFSGARQPGEDLTLSEVEQRGKALDDAAQQAAYRERARAVRPDDLATIIYTSGTTGDPKGVMLTHDNLYSNVVAAAATIPFAGGEVCLSFLPLSHVFERMAGHYRSEERRVG